MYRNVGEPFGWGVRDRENHVTMVALWKKAPALLAWMPDMKSLAKRNAELTAKAHEGYGYRFLDFISLQAGDEKAEGYRFSYEKDGITQVSNNLLVRDGKMIYSFILAGREENAAQDRDLFLEIMRTLEYC